MDSEVAIKLVLNYGMWSVEKDGLLCCEEENYAEAFKFASELAAQVGRPLVVDNGKELRVLKLEDALKKGKK